MNGLQKNASEGAIYFLLYKALLFLREWNYSNYNLN